MKASGFVSAWVAVQAGVREPQRLLCACYPSLLAKVRSLAFLHQRFGFPDRCPESRYPSGLAVAVLGVYCTVAMSELTRCVFAMLGARGCVFRDI